VKGDIGAERAELLRFLDNSTARVNAASRYLILLKQ
jgi:hypothetical protein